MELCRLTPGIGGGLATTVGLSAWLGVAQHQAQLVSPVLSTIPAAWVYWSSGWMWSWLVIISVIVGLIIGTDLGARVVNRLGKEWLQATLIVFVPVMAVYMTLKALG
jgi:uncharacterized membrane protein YfcA